MEGANLHENILRLLRYFTYNPELMKQHIDIFETNLTPEQFTAANNALAGFDFRKGLPKVSEKTLVISGKYNGLNWPEEGKEVASLTPKSTYIEMQYSRHVPTHEEPKTYLKIMEDFFLGL